MKLETFFEKFDQFADAPDAVTKIRKMVLNFAVKGKLVPQDPNDAQAEIDFDSLVNAREKSSLKRTKIDREAVVEDLSTPASWLSISLGELVSIRTGFAFKSGDYAEQGTFILRVTNINPDGSLDTSNSVFLPDDKLDEKMQGFLLDEHELLVVMVGGSLGKIGQVTAKILPALLNQNMWRLKSYSDRLDNRFLRLVLQDLNENRLQITQSTHGHLAMATYAAAKVPFPPLAEQKRIVAKVDELMALCDRLEAQQQERETRHTVLARASLTRFADAPTPANLQFLFHPSYTITPADLRKSILTLAVQGKLVPQDPNDQPVEASAESDSLFDIPESWKWRRLGSLGLCRTGKTPPTSDPSNYGVGFPFIGPGQITQDGSITTSEKTITSKGLVNSTEASVSDILMVCIGGSIGKAAICHEPLGFNQQINSVRLKRDLPEFVYLAVTAGYFQEQLIGNASGSATPIINKGKWEQIPVPIPPLAEQRRIVAKVEQLMALVDALETQLAASRTTAANLLSALVAELTGTPNNRHVSVSPSTGSGRRGRPRKA